MTVDLSALAFIDLAGARALADLAVFIAPGDELTLVSPPPMLRRIIDIIGVSPPGRIVWRSDRRRRG